MACQGAEFELVAVFKAEKALVCHVQNRIALGDVSEIEQLKIHVTETVVSVTF